LLLISLSLSVVRVVNRVGITETTKEEEEEEKNKAIHELRASRRCDVDALLRAVPAARRRLCSTYEYLQKKNPSFHRQNTASLGLPLFQTQSSTPLSRC
jgi:hypothetical protein